MKHLRNSSVTLRSYLCSRFLINLFMIMDKAKAIKIQRWYDYIRLTVILVFIGLLIYLTL